MKNYLIYQEGVPEDIIIEDPKGFNTYKSILRCKDVYKKKNVIIVSQGFIIFVLCFLQEIMI
jgi:SanA protein